MSEEHALAPVSVVMPAYKAANTIARALRSVLSGTLQPREILVIDDGSPDDIAAAVAEFGPKVRLIRQQNAGASSARNAGLNLATQEFIAFLDADDYWEPRALETRLAAFAAHPSAGAVASRFYEQAVNPADRGAAATGKRWLGFVEHPELYGRLSRPADRRAFAVGMCIFTSVLVIRRSALGDMRFESGLEPAEDRDLWIRLAKKSDVFLIDEPLGTAVLEEGSLSRSNIDRDYRNMLRVVERHADTLGPHGVRRQESIVFRRWAARCLASGKPGEAVRPAWSRLRRQPLSPQGWWIACKASILACSSNDAR